MKKMHFRGRQFDSEIMKYDKYWTFHFLIGFQHMFNTYNNSICMMHRKTHRIHLVSTGFYL